MLTIYHNPRCRKSREGLEILERSGKAYQVRQYLKEGLKKAEVIDLLQKLGLRANDVIRKNEKIWKEEYKNLSPSEAEIVNALVAHPILLERPVVMDGKRAVIGRPPEKIADMLSASDD